MFLAQWMCFRMSAHQNCGEGGGAGLPSCGNSTVTREISLAGCARTHLSVFVKRAKFASGEIASGGEIRL